ARHAGDGLVGTGAGAALSRARDPGAGPVRDRGSLSRPAGAARGHARVRGGKPDPGGGSLRTLGAAGRLQPAHPAIHRGTTMKDDNRYDSYREDVPGRANVEDTPELVAYYR